MIEKLSVNSSSLSQLQQRVRKEKIETCLVYVKDELVFQYYRNKKASSKLYKIHSATKSILSILVGIAVDKGLLEGVHVPLSHFFPEIENEKQNITIENLLTMSPGLHWPEFGEWGGRAFPMLNSKDWTQFVLGRSMIERPGQQMYYNSGCSHLLSAIMQNITGVKLSDYARENLFAPLGIDDYIWHSNSKGIDIGASGLSMKAGDMAKIGKLMLQNGIWNGKEIVSAGWINESTKARFLTYRNIGCYGYHWWVLTDRFDQPAKPHAFFAMGYEGQYIIAVPDYGMITIFTSSMPNQTFLPLELFKEHVYQNEAVQNFI